VSKIAEKSSLKECVFVNWALKIQCHVVKNTLLQTAFSAILPTGKGRVSNNQIKKTIFSGNFKNKNQAEISSFQMYH